MIINKKFIQALTIGVAGCISSSPFLFFLVNSNLNKWDSLYLHILGNLSSIFVGVIAIGWFYILKSRHSPCSKNSLEKTCVIVAILTVYTLAIGWGLVAEMTHKDSFINAFSVFGLYGMFYFWWLVLLVGWQAGRLGGYWTKNMP